MQEKSEEEFMLDVQALSPPAVCMHPTRGWYFLLLQLLPSPHMNSLTLPPLCPLCTRGPAATSSIPQSSWEHPSQLWGLHVPAPLAKAEAWSSLHEDISSQALAVLAARQQ